ncbi:MAG: cell division protein ZapA [Treponema sp.]|nr:cell division protein ZapA [Treponema sp.]
MGKLKIDLLGTSFTIQAAEDEEYLKKLLSYYSRIANHIESNGMLKDPLQISILAGIMICDELYNEKAQNAKTFKLKSDTNDAEAERLTLEMIQKIDQALQ